MKKHVYRHDNIVIGGNLPSLIFVYLNNYKLIITKPEIPYVFEHFESDRDLSKLKIENIRKALTSPTGDVPFGLNKIDLYENLYYRLAITGKIIYELPTQSIRVNKEKNLIKIVSDRSRLYYFKYNNLFTFHKNITGLDFDLDVDHYQIINEFEIKRAFKHEYECLKEQEGGIINFGLFTKYTDLITTTKIEKDKLDPHIDFYIKNYLEKYMRSLLRNHPKHLVKVINKKSIKKEILEEKIISCDNVSLITLSEESILDGKSDSQKQFVSI